GNDRTDAGLKKAIVLYERALELDPGYGRAHAALADSYLLLRNYARQRNTAELLAKARFHARRALDSDETLAEAHTSLASIAEADFDWPTADREHRRAIEFRPDYARGHHWYGLFLRDQGRFTESDAELDRAMQLEPTSMP